MDKETRQKLRELVDKLERIAKYRFSEGDNDRRRILEITRDMEEIARKEKLSEGR